MSMRSRALGQIETELNQRLSFRFTLIRNVTRPGELVLGPGDRFLFSASLRNDCGFRLSNVRGVIAPTPFSEFKRLSFAVPDLIPGEQVEIASAEARLTELPPQGLVVDQIARLRLTTGVDLSEFRFQQWVQPLMYGLIPGRLDRQTQRRSTSHGRRLVEDSWGPVLPLIRTADF